MIVRRLGPHDLSLAAATFSLMDGVFEAPPANLSPAYLTRLLARDDFVAFVAVDGDTPVGGATAHALPMTRRESTELFLYDIAVSAAHQRRGIGRALLDALRAHATAAGYSTLFVPADVEDTHALDFYRALGGQEAPVSIFAWELGDG